MPLLSLQSGVVHRDLKLENILLDQDLNVKVSLIRCTQAFISLPNRGRKIKKTRQNEKKINPLTKAVLALSTLAHPKTLVKLFCFGT